MKLALWQTKNRGNLNGLKISDSSLNVYSTPEASAIVPRTILSRFNVIVEPPPLVPQPIAAVRHVDVAAGVSGFVVNGKSAEDLSGHAVSMAGDVNGDGLGDLIIGAPGGDSVIGGSSGRSYLVFGKRTGEAIELSAIERGEGGFVINGQETGDCSGFSVSLAGDVNGDGLADLLIGAPRCGNDAIERTGRSYVVFGKPSGEPVNLSTVVNGHGGFVINGEVEGDSSGDSVSALGDVNGDGLADFAIGAPDHATAAGQAAGSSYVVFGKNSGEPVDLIDVANGQGGFVIDGLHAEGYSGSSISAAGDVNGDGLADLLIGAALDDPASRSYLIFGKPTGDAVDLSAIEDGQGGFVIIGQHAENHDIWSVSPAGDVNGDGLADLLIGASDSALGAGRSYVVFGKRTGEAVDLSEVANSQGGFVINGPDPGDHSGQSLAPAGDINGDGLADVFIGASGSATGGGRSYVVFGKITGEAVDLSSVANGLGGFAIVAQRRHDGSGEAISPAGDVNGDGLADLLVGAPYGSPAAKVAAGRTYVIYGDEQRAVAVDEFGTDGDDVLIGTPGVDTLVGKAGNDVLTGNAADVLIGGPGNDTFIVEMAMAIALQSPMGEGGNDAKLARIDGGSGIDTLRMWGGADLDLTQVANQAASASAVISRISSVEWIDMASDILPNTLQLDVRDVLDMAGMNLFNLGNGWEGLGETVTRHQLVIDGTLLDTLDVADAGEWSRAGRAAHGEQIYNIWNHSLSMAQLLVADELQTRGTPPVAISGAVVVAGAAADEVKGVDEVSAPSTNTLRPRLEDVLDIPLFGKNHGSPMNHGLKPEHSQGVDGAKAEVLNDINDETWSVANALGLGGLPLGVSGYVEHLTHLLFAKEMNDPMASMFVPFHHFAFVAGAGWALHSGWNGYSAEGG